MTLNGTMTELLFAMNQGSEETTVFLYTENKQPEDKTEKVIVLKKKKLQGQIEHIAERYKASLNK